MMYCYYTQLKNDIYAEFDRRTGEIILTMRPQGGIAKELIKLDRETMGAFVLWREMVDRNEEGPQS